MVAWAVVLVCLVVVTGRTEAPEKAVISLYPLWATIFRGDRSILTCQAPKGQVSYYDWYKDGKDISGASGNTISVKETRDSGVYTCRTSNSEASDPVRITVSDDWAILQTPYYAVFEGDELYLNCLGWRANTVTQVWYYRNTQKIESFKSQKSLPIKNVGRQNSGTYHCTVELSKVFIPYKYNSQEVQIDVKELFSSPSLKVRQSTEPEEGSRMKLVCYTEVSQEKRSSTVLRYALYINERNVFKDQSSPEFDIAALQLSDSGSYKCVVQTISNQVRKESSVLWIRVKRKHVDGTFLEVQPQNREVIEGEKLTMTCFVAEGTGKIIFSWCRQETKTCTSQNMVNTKSAKHTITAMTEEDSGQYYCTASNDPSRGPIKSSAVKIDVKLRVSKPLLTLEVDDDRVAVGDAVVIQCASKRGSPPIEYQFYHQGTHVGTVTVPQIEPGRYTINSVSLEHSGVYYCHANNGIQNGNQRSETVTLSIIVPVSGATLRMDRASPEVLVGENLTLTCTVALGSSPVIRWIHNEKEADEASGMYQLLSPGNSLHIKSVQPEHGGSYVCQARNQVNQKRAFNSTSNIMSITVIEANNALQTAVATLGPLVVIAVIAILLFVYCKQKKKTDDRYFTAPVSNHQTPEQSAPISPTAPSSVNPVQLYSNVPAASFSTNDTDVVYAVIDTKAKRRAPTLNAATLQENLDYYVTYSSLKIGKRDKAAGHEEFNEAEEHDNLYENFQNK